MRAPPAAVWRVERDPRWQCLHSLMFAASAAVLAIWTHQHLQPMWFAGSGSKQVLTLPSIVASDLALVAMAAMAAAAAAALGWRLGRQAQGRVLWTGSEWRWQARSAADTTAAVRVELMLDTGHWLLLRLRAPTPDSTGAQHVPTWLSLRGPGGQHRGEQTQWGAFRAAVYCAAIRSSGPSNPHSPLTLNDRSGL